MSTVEMFGVALGTPLQGGAVVLLAGILGFIIRVWITGIPDRKRADNEGRVIDNAEVALRFREWRAEVHAMKNELAVVKAELHQSNAQRARNRDRFNMVLFILRMVMAELRRIDPESPVIKQAHELLKQVTDQEDDQSDAVSSAKATVAAAEETLHEVEKGADK